MKRVNLLLCLLSILAAGCIALPRAGSQGGCPESIPTPAPSPSFLPWVSPVGLISKAEYDESIRLAVPGLVEAGGVKLKIYASGIDKVVPNRTDSGRGKALSDRISILINGVDYSKNQKEMMDGMMADGPFLFSWVIDLPPGYYNVILNFDADAGETMTYSWNFCIVP